MEQRDATCSSCGEFNLLAHGKIPPFCASCRFPLTLLAGKYKMQRALSEGGFGVVYLAQHVNLDIDTERAVKVMKADTPMFEEHMKRRFRREVQVTSALSQRN